MGIGIFLTLLQSISEFFKALARSRGLLLGDRITSYNVCYTKLLRKIFKLNGFLKQFMGANDYIYRAIS